MLLFISTIALAVPPQHTSTADVQFSATEAATPAAPGAHTFPDGPLNAHKVDVTNITVDIDIDHTAQSEIGWPPLLEQSWLVPASASAVVSYTVTADVDITGYLDGGALSLPNAERLVASESWQWTGSKTVDDAGLGTTTITDIFSSDEEGWSFDSVETIGSESVRVISSGTAETHLDLTLRDVVIATGTKTFDANDTPQSIAAPLTNDGVVSFESDWSADVEWSLAAEWHANTSWEVQSGTSLDVVGTTDQAWATGSTGVTDDEVSYDHDVPAARIGGDPTSLDFGTVLMGESAGDTLTISNLGMLELDGSASASGPGFSVDTSPFSIDDSTLVTRDVSFTPTASGSVSGSVVVTTNDPLQPEITIALAGDAVAPITLLDEDLPSATMGQAFSHTFTVTSAFSAPTLTVKSGALPDGLTLTGLELAGTPTTPGTYPFTLTAADDLSEADVAFSVEVISVASNLQLDTSALPAGVAGSGYEYPLEASGGTAPYTWAASGLPAGLSVVQDGADWLVSGTPDAAGTYPVTLTVTDDAGASDSTQVPLEIDEAEVADPVDTGNSNGRPGCSHVAETAPGAALMLLAPVWLRRRRRSRNPGLDALV